MLKFDPIFQVDEYIFQKATDRLQRIARVAQDKLINQSPLPQPFQVLTNRTIFGISCVGGKFKKVSEQATPIRWERSIFGRQRMRLVVEIQLIFTRNQSTFWNFRRKTIIQNSTAFRPLVDEFPSIDDVALPKGVVIPCVFRTNVEILPLTAQEAAFAGCQQAYHNNNIIWGGRKKISTTSNIYRHGTIEKIVEDL